MEFEKLHIHKVRGESVLLKRNCTTLRKEGTFKPVSGYLVKTTHLFRGASSPKTAGFCLSFKGGAVHECPYGQLDIEKEMLYV